MTHDVSDINGLIFNVGSDEQNYQILPLAKLVGSSLGIDFNIDWYGSPDSRSYKVSFKKFKEVMRFRPQYTPKEGAVEIFEALKTGKLVDSLKTKTVEWYKHLISSYELVMDASIRNTIL
jgi:nucleoside-diphosphate-sugar epimerase